MINCSCASLFIVQVFFWAALCVFAGQKCAAERPILINKAGNILPDKKLKSHRNSRPLLQYTLAFSVLQRYINQHSAIKVVLKLPSLYGEERLGIVYGIRWNLQYYLHPYIADINLYLKVRFDYFVVDVSILKLSSISIDEKLPCLVVEILFENDKLAFHLSNIKICKLIDVHYEVIDVESSFYCYLFSTIRHIMFLIAIKHLFL